MLLLINSQKYHSVVSSFASKSSRVCRMLRNGERDVELSPKSAAEAAAVFSLVKLPY